MLKLINIVFIILISGFQTGCSTLQSENYTASNQTLEIIHTDNISVVSARLVQDGSECLVKGRVKRDITFKSESWGYVELTALDQAKQVIWKKYTYCLPARIPMYTSSPFQFHLDDSLAESKTYHIQFRRGTIPKHTIY